MQNYTRYVMVLSFATMVLVLQVACSTNPSPEDEAWLERERATWAADYGCTQPNAGSGVVMATRNREENGSRYKPEVGWDACELMFALGFPNKEDSQDTEHGRYRNWWCGGYSSLHLITLTFRPEQPGARSPWVVTYVGW